MLPASGLWALIPVVGQGRLGTSAAGFGLLIGSLGLGAIIGGLSLPSLRRRGNIEATLATASLCYALVLALTASLRNIWTLCPALMLGGASWSIALTLLNAAMLTSVPLWVRSRTIALSMLASQGFMAGGAALWGAIASHGGPDLSLALASGLMIILLIAFRHHRVGFGVESDVTLAPAEVQPSLASPVAPEAGPVAVEVRYRIDPRQREDFIRASEPVGALRRRNGARMWRLYRDLADEAVFVERFIVDSWADYQRHLTRSTMADHAREERMRSFVQDGQGVDVSHFLAER
jgi:MFS family permease